MSTNNKNQLQAHQFMLQRVISALTVGETDPEQPPFRRPTMAAIGALVLVVLSLAGVWVYGLLVPGGDRFTATDTIAVEQETGARYVLTNGQLHPVLNYTSALLALDQHASVRMVAHATLAGIPVGVPIGIPGAPDSLPGPSQLLTGGWAACSQGAAVTVLVGHQPNRSAALGAQALLVRSGNQLYVIYQGFRHEVTAGVDIAMGLRTDSMVTVSGSWLDMIPAGRPLAPAQVAGSGQPSTAVPGLSLVTGQVIEIGDPATASQNQYYLVLGTALQQIGPLQASIQQVVGPHPGPPTILPDSAILGAAQTAPQTPADGDPPWTPPRFVTVDDPQSPVCATFQPGNAIPQLAVDASLSSADRAAQPAAGTQIGVAVPAGSAALIELMDSPDAAPGQGTVALVTDQGRLYPVDDPQHELAVLGLDSVPPVRITSVVADSVPEGPSLSAAAARMPANGG
ncbi:MAG TPA: type VII secretion protein EccB [Pseudonocardiaceae bacterium]|nr:type VII secretion protein EccB [Pseudonocardiaceae bacterium]